jgi:uncharacterized protein
VRIGLISDTHGLLRPAVFTHFEGVDRILHAGDIGPVELLTELEALAPVSGVYGNTDGFDVRARCPELLRLELLGTTLLVVHGHQLGSPTPDRLVERYPGHDVIVHGHTHLRALSRSAGTLVINPGAAGQRRFRTQPSLAVLTLGGGGEVVDFINL